MGFLWDFFGTLFHWGKTQADNTAEQNASKNNEKVQWYWNLNGETVQVVDNETTWEWLASWIINLPNTISSFWNNVIWDPLTSKQSVDEQLLWLKYNWEAVTDDQKNQYIQKLSQYQKLADKSSLTVEEAVQKQFLQNDLDKYTVPDTMQNWQQDNWWFWYDTWVSRVFWNDRIRNNAALNDENATRIPVDREKILWLMDDSNWRTWNQFGANDPQWRTWWGETKVYTRDEFDKEKKRNEINDEINTLLDKRVKEAIDSWFVAPWNPWGRKSTEDEVRWLFEAVLQDRAVAANLDPYREAYAFYKDKDPEIAREFKDMSVKLVDMATYILMSDKDNNEAYQEFVEENGNPLEFDVDNLDQNQLTDYWRTMIYSNLATLWQEVDDYLPNWVTIAFKWDWAHIANTLLRWWMTWEKMWKWNILWWAWNALEWASATIGSWFSSALWHVAWYSTIATNLIKDWTITEWDFNAAMFWWQSSSMYNLKQNYQQEWADPDYFWADIAYVIKQYWSITDDIAEARAITKLVDFPVKIAELKNVNKVLVEGKKLEKAVEVWTKVEKAASVWETIVKDVEKATKTMKAETFFNRVWNAVKSVFTKSDEVKAWEKAVQMIWKDMALIKWENITRWIADEAITSAMYQWMTPYTYSQEDLSMDIFWAVFSGLLRAKAYNNRMWMFKYNAMNSVWTEWYLSEVMGYSRSQTIEAMEKLNPKTINMLWWSIKSKFAELFDTDTYMSKADMKSKSALLWDWVRDATNKMVEDMIERSEQNLMRSLADSLNPKYTKLVKKLRIKNTDWTYTTKYEWNKPKWMKQSTFDNLKKNARVEIYSPKGLDNINTIKWRSEMLNKIRAVVRKNLAAMASRGSKTTRDLVEKVNWRWRFKKSVSKATIDALEQKYFKIAAEKRWLWLNSLLKKWAGKDKWMWFDVQDYTKEKMWPIQQRFALYINSQILWKKLSKRAILDWLWVYWDVMKRCFKRWMKETHNVWDIEELSEKEIIAAMMEFWKTVDEFIFPDFIRRWEMSNINEPLANDKNFIANLTYDEAVKVNPDLKYMSPEEFHLIQWSELSIVQKELKLRWFERISAVNWNHIFWLNPGSKMWEITFHDTLEEKCFMWDSWEVYIQINPEWWANVIAKNSDKYPSQIKDIDKRSAKKYKYKLEDKSKWDTWTRKYSIHDDNGLLIWYIETKSNYHLPEWKKSPDLSDIYWSSRTMTITLMDTNIWWKSVELEFTRWKQIPVIQKYDQSMKLPDSKRMVTNRYFDTKMWWEVPETALQQWNWLTVWIRDWWKDYNNFCKQIPGYTDRVPQSYFNLIVNDKTLSTSDKMNMLIWAMFNRHIVETSEWIKFDVAWWKTFNRKWYSYNTYRKNPKWWRDYVRVTIPWDNEVYFSALSDWWVVLVRADWASNAEAFFYKPGRNPLQFEIYRSIDDKKPAGVISFQWNRITWYFRNKWWRKQILWDVEFMHNNSNDFVQDALSKRYNETDWVIRVDWWDEMYREIYKELYWAEMPEAEYLKVKNTPNMTPERYLNQIVDEFKQSRFWRYSRFKKWDWRSQIQQMNRFKVISSYCDNYIKRYPSTNLTDAMIYKAAERFVNESVKSNWVITLSKAEAEIRDIMYWKNARAYDANSMINIYWHSMFWVEPPADMFRSEVLQRLRNRREAILLALYKDQSIKSWSDYEQSAFLSRMKRKLWRDIKNWSDVSLEDLIEDIKAHPDEYQAIASKFWEKIKKVEDEKAKADEADNKLLEQKKKRRDELEKEVWWPKPKKVKWPDTDKISHLNYEWQKQFFEDRLANLNDERLKLLESWDVSPEWRARLAELNREIDECNQSLDLLNENISYIESKKLWEMTEEEYEYLVDAQLRWEWVFEAWWLSRAQIDERVNQIKNNIPWCRVLEYDPVTWRLDTRWLTKEERKIFANTLERATNALSNGEARAAHIWQLHAIVMNPNNVSVFDLWHEWFHEAVWLMTDQSRRYEVFEEAYTKFWDQIEDFARRRWYAEEFDWLDDLTYKRKITEEWLAERFWEYVQWRLELENNVIMKFFKELWTRIKLMFSDTQVMDLFDDIYEWRIKYNPIKSDLSPADVNSIDYRLTKDATVDYVNSWRIAYWENMNIQELIDAVGSDDALILTNSRFTWKWNYFSSKKQVVQMEDWREILTSYDELYEWLMKRDKEIWVDNAIKFLFWSDWDFYNWLSNKNEAKYKSAIIWDWAMMVEVHYPDNWDWTTIADFKLMIPKWAEWAKTFTIEWITNTTIDNLSRLLAKQEYNAILKALQTYSLNAESIKLAEIDPSAYEAHIKALWPNYDRFINKYMPDVLEKSIDEYQHWVRDVSFNDMENIDQIEEILNRAHRTLLFDRCIPHTNWARNGVVVDIYNWLYNRKWQRTMKLIQDVIDLWDKHLTYKIWRSRWKCPVIQFIFTDRLWKERIIWWHMTDAQVLQWKEMWWWKYSNVDEMMWEANLHAPWWHKSMLVDPEWTKYKKEWKIWTPLDEKVRSSLWFKNPISFRRPLDVNWNPIDRVYRFDWITIQTDEWKWFVVQKNMTMWWFEWALKNHWWISSSVALSEDFISWYDSKFWSIALLWRKLWTEWNKVPFKWYEFFTSDTWTPILQDVVVADFQLSIRDVVDKYADRLDWYIKLPKSIKKELDNVIKSYWLDIKKTTKDDQYRSLINWSRNNDYTEKSDMLSEIKYKLSNYNIKDNVVVNLLKDKQKLWRIFNEVFNWRLAWINEWWLRKALALDEVDQYMLWIRSWRNDLIKNWQRPQVWWFNEMLEEWYIYDKSTWLLDFESTYNNIKDWPILREQYRLLNMNSENAYRRYIKELIIMSDLYNSSNRYFEWYSKVLNLNDFHSIVVSKNDIQWVMDLLNKYNYKYHLVENIEWMTHEDFEKLIDEYANKENSFLLIQDWFIEEMTELDEEWQAIFYDEIYTNSKAERTAEKEFALINRRTDNTNVSDETLEILQRYWLTWPIIWISDQKYIDNMKAINDTLRKNNYNMKKNAPELYEERQSLKKNRVVNAEQTWANSKRRILNKEYRDLNREIREIEDRMAIRQEQYDEFLETPMYYQATKLREALDSSAEARDAVRRSYEESNKMVPESTSDYKPRDTYYWNNKETTSTMPPLAKDIYKDNYYQITYWNPVSDFLDGWDEALMSAKNPYRAAEMNIIWWEVDVCLPVWPSSVTDPYLLDNIVWADSFAIWATDTDTLNKFKAKIEDELPDYKNIYDRPDWNVAYYTSNDNIKASDQVNFRRNRTEAKQQLAKQIEEDKDITEASMWSVIDNSLICKI